MASLEPGKCADFFAINLNRIGFTGMHDPVAAVVFGQSVNVDYTVVGGKFVVKEGQLCTVDEGKLIEKHNKAAKRLLVTLRRCKVSIAVNTGSIVFGWPAIITSIFFRCRLG